MAAPYRMGLAVIVVVFVIVSGMLYLKASTLQDSFEIAKSASRTQARYSLGCLAGDLGRLDDFAKDNSRDLVLVTLYHISDCAMASSQYFMMLYKLTGNTSYLRAANSLDELSIIADGIVQGLLSGEENQSAIMERIAESKGFPAVHDAVRSVIESMRGGQDPAPQACEQLADAVGVLSGEFP